MSIKFIYILLLILASASVAVADVFLKKSSFMGLTTFLKSPWMIGAILLYIFQIFIFIYLFVTGMKLVDVGIIQIILYALIVLASGILFFHETLTLVKIIGIMFGLIGVILINL